MFFPLLNQSPEITRGIVPANNLEKPGKLEIMVPATKVCVCVFSPLELPGQK